MKSTAKDIILLCKRRYDREKYPSILEALKEYYRKNYIYGSHDMDDQLNERFILRVILVEVMREIARDYPDRLTFFINGYLVHGQILFGIPDESNMDYDYQMFYRIVNFLSSLRMRGEGFINIDTSEYFYETEDEDGYLCRKLIEEII